MRVLHIVPVAGASGAERHLVQLLAGLKRHGVDVGAAYIDLGSTNYFVETLRNYDVPVWDISGRGTLVSQFNRLHNLIRESDPNILHTHLTKGHILGHSMRLLHSIPSVMSLHSAHPLFGHNFRKLPTLLSMHLAEQIISNSHYVAQIISDTSRSCAKKTSVVHYGIDSLDWMRPHSGRPTAKPDTQSVTPLTLTMTSRLIPGKGHLFALDAFAELQHRMPQLRLTIAGSGPLESRLTHEIESRNLERVELVGRVADVRPLLAETDIFLMLTAPTLGEGFGLALLEAMASGVPAIATRCGSLPELLVPGDTGFLVDFGDVQGLTETIQTLSRNPELRLAMGRRSRERAQKTFGVHEMIMRTDVAYRRLVEHK